MTSKKEPQSDQTGVQPPPKMTPNSIKNHSKIRPSENTQILTKKVSKNDHSDPWKWGARLSETSIRTVSPKRQKVTKMEGRGSQNRGMGHQKRGLKTWWFFDSEKVTKMSSKWLPFGPTKAHFCLPWLSFAHFCSPWGSIFSLFGSPGVLFGFCSISSMKILYKIICLERFHWKSTCRSTTSH